MRKTNKIILFTLIIVVLLLGVGYASIQNITLNITGTAAADPSQSNFKVMFTGTPVVSDSNYVTATITDELNATINVSGLTTKGQTVTAEYIVQNVSTDLSADLAVSVVNSNTEYFRITSELAKTSLTAGEATTLTLTIELIKTPLTEVSSTIGTQLESMPVQPGEEGSSGLTNDFSQDPEKVSITNKNIGEYIDLGNDIVDFNGTSNVTTDDWRILYVEDDTVYAILSRSLPENVIDLRALGFADVYSMDSVSYPTGTSDDFISLFKKSEWNFLANGITGATVQGAPNADMIINSYNAKNGTELSYIDLPTFDSNLKDYDLYVAESMNSNRTNGYWTATKYDDNTLYVVSRFSGALITEDKYASGYGNSLRPVVALPASLTYELVNGVWVVD